MAKKKDRKTVWLHNKESGDLYVVRTTSKDVKLSMKKYSRKLRKHVKFDQKTIVYKQK